jgi:hypothetical protein
MPCNQAVNPLNGVLSSTQNQRFYFGLTDPTSGSVNDTPDKRAAPGCTAYVAAPGLNAMPAMDVNGNSTNGAGSIGEYAPVNLNIINALNITYAGENALDDAANRIRGSATLPTVIFAIGLGNIPGSLTPDPVLMPRIANDPSSPYYNSSQLSGQYIFAPTTGQLQTAFTSIASQVLKLAQ